MNKILSQLIGISLYRLEKCMNDASEEFLSLSIGNGVRSPQEIISHMVDVASFSFKMIGKQAPSVSQKDYPAFVEIYKQLKDILQKGPELEFNLTQQLINGPLSDNLTHVGQIAMIKRLAGNPVKKEQFYKVKIE